MNEGERLEGVYICPVCQRRIEQMVRVGHLLLADPCTHPVLDLRVMPWFKLPQEKR